MARKPKLAPGPVVQPEPIDVIEEMLNQRAPIEMTLPELARRIAGRRLCPGTYAFVDRNIVFDPASEEYVSDKVAQDVEKIVHYALVYYGVRRLREFHLRILPDESITYSLAII